MTNMVCVACVLGVSIGFGGLILYRALKRWFQQRSLEHPLLCADVEHTCNSRNLELVPGKAMV